MIWLGIDTANTPLSIAIVKDGQVITEENTSRAVNHSLRAMPAIEEAFERANIVPADIDAIAVSEGPGSYTGARIGVTIAKTLAWTLDKPLVGISSLKVLAMNGLFFNGLICPLIDARRSHVYAGLYEAKEGQLIEYLEDRHTSMADLLAALKTFEGPILFIGTDVALYEEMIKETLGEQAAIAPAQFHLPRASGLIDIAQKIGEEVDIHQFVPEYRRIAEAEANWLKAQRKD